MRYILPVIVVILSLLSYSFALVVSSRGFETDRQYIYFASYSLSLSLPLPVGRIS